ncbi:MAG: hypothetical protein J6R73_08380, partial [Alistipes sp.]|nr:hypothetical protein [Alistipes sp.]
YSGSNPLQTSEKSTANFAVLFLFCIGAGNRSAITQAAAHSDPMQASSPRPAAWLPCSPAPNGQNARLQRLLTWGIGLRG